MFAAFNRKIFITLIVLSAAQIVGWGSLGLPAIAGRQMAADLQMNLSAVFAGSSVLYVFMGLCSPWLAGFYVRHGARRVMAVGAVATAPGFVLLALAQGPISYFCAWVVLGLAASATLTTSAYVALNEIAGNEAKSAISGLMLLTGLSSSVFWPLASMLTAVWGWRGTCFLYAACMLVVCFPLYFFGLPRRIARQGAVPAASQGDLTVRRHSSRSTFHLISAALALNAFVTFGFASVFVEVLKATGLEAAEAVAFGAALGVIQVSARGIDMLGGARWDGVTTGIVAGLLMPIGLLCLLLGKGSYGSAIGFILLYGLASGALAVARATIPLVFYDKQDYARAASRIALPLNFLSALAPPTQIWMLAHLGLRALLTVALACTCGALLILFLLSGRRPSPG